MSDVDNHEENEHEEIRGDPETRKRRLEEYIGPEYPPDGLPDLGIEDVEGDRELPTKRESSVTEIPALKRERIDMPSDTLYFKILIPNTLIGNIIGKGGSCVNGMMMRSQAKIKVSQNHEFFPDTEDRVIVISGLAENIHLAISEILSKYCEIYDKDPRSQLSHTAPSIDPLGNRKYQIRATIPIGASGSILGRGGATIRELADRTGTKVQLVETTDPYQTRERIMVVSASSAHSGAVVFQTIFNQLQTLDKSIGTYSNTTSNYGAAGRAAATAAAARTATTSYPIANTAAQSSYYQPYYSAAAAYQQYYSGGRAAASPASAAANSQYYQSANGQVGYTVQIGVPDVLIGSVLGRGGSTVKDIMAQSGARIHVWVAQKGEHMPGTTNRCVTVTGTQQQVELAQALIMHQLNVGASTAGYHSR